MNNIPVLVIIYNRPNKFKRLIEKLQNIKSKKIYVFADGPNKLKKNDLSLCKNTRKLVSSINWECKVYKNYQKENWGVDLGVYNAITWFFNKVKFGIILEDDCLPNLSFFKFVKILKSKYSRDKNIGIISGNNFIKKNYKYSYFFSKWPHTWGWATWKKNWVNFDYDINFWKKLRKSNKWKLLNENFTQYKTFTHVYDQILDKTKKKDITWDYRYMLYCWNNNLLNIVPRYNLVKNIGFGKNANHTFVKNKKMNYKLNNLKFPLNHPNKNYIDTDFETKNFYISYYNKNFFLIEILKNLKFLIKNFFNR